MFNKKGDTVKDFVLVETHCHPLPYLHPLQGVQEARQAQANPLDPGCHLDQQAPEVLSLPRKSNIDI